MQKARFFRSLYSHSCVRLLSPFLPLTVMAGPGEKKNTSVHVHADFEKGYDYIYFEKTGLQSPALPKRQLWDGPMKVSLFRQISKNDC